MEREEYALEASAAENKPSFHSSRCFIIRAPPVRRVAGKDKLYSKYISIYTALKVQEQLISTVSSGLELNNNRFFIFFVQKKEINKTSEFTMSTRSSGITESTQPDV